MLSGIFGGSTGQWEKDPNKWKPSNASQFSSDSGSAVADAKRISKTVSEQGREDSRPEGFLGHGLKRPLSSPSYLQDLSKQKLASLKKMSEEYVARQTNGQPSYDEPNQIHAENAKFITYEEEFNDRGINPFEFADLDDTKIAGIAVDAGKKYNKTDLTTRSLVLAAGTAFAADQLFNGGAVTNAGYGLVKDAVGSFFGPADGPTDSSLLGGGKLQSIFGEANNLFGAGFNAAIEGLEYLGLPSDYGKIVTTIAAAGVGLAITGEAGQRGGWMLGTGMGLAMMGMVMAGANGSQDVDMENNGLIGDYVKLTNRIADYDQHYTPLFGGP